MWITAKQMHFAVMLDGDRQLVETQRCINFDHGLMYRPGLNMDSNVSQRREKNGF